MERAEIEFVALLHARVSEKFDDLQFADLIRNGLARPGGKRDRFLARSLFIHRDFVLQVFGGLFQREFAERKFHVHFHSQRAEAHEVVNDLASVRAVVEQAGLQHHFFGVKANPFIRAGIIVMPPNRSPRVSTRDKAENNDREFLHER